MRRSPPQADAGGLGVSPSLKIPPRWGDTGGLKESNKQLLKFEVVDLRYRIPVFCLGSQTVPGSAIGATSKRLMTLSMKKF